MANIKAADVAKLRNMTGAGMMDCKKALQESNGDFDAAIDILRKKGQKVASKRAEREATEGAAIATVSDDKKKGVVIVLNCETDFVAKNDDFVAFAKEIAGIAAKSDVDTLEALKASAYKDYTVEEEVTNKTGVIGEKIDLAQFAVVKAAYSVHYIHPGNKVATVVGFSKEIDKEAARNIAMQIAAMAPIAVDKESVPQDVIDKEIEIGKEQAIQEGKPEDLAEKIAKGRLNKFFAERTLVNQQFIKDSKITVKQYLQSVDKDVKVVDFKRIDLNN